MSLRYSYRHLYYFWAVANAGGVARAAARLGVAVQTVSSQVHELERDLGHALLKPAGRGLALTEAGAAARRVADQIFQLGEELPGVVRDAASEPVVRLAVGIADGLPKLVVQHLLQPVLGEAHLRLSCEEGHVDELVAALALHRIDIVLADRAAPANPNVRVYSHPAGASTLSWYATPALRAQARKQFPASLARIPVLLPTSRSAVREDLDAWFSRLGVAPHVVGEFGDSALLKTFGAAGMGAFAAADLVHDDLVARYGVARIGPCDGVEERFFAIGTERKVVHPLVQRLIAAATARTPRERPRGRRGARNHRTA
jgi:LysR family transcriptional activator of nhaA